MMYRVTLTIKLYLNMLFMIAVCNLIGSSNTHLKHYMDGVIMVSYEAHCLLILQI